MESLFLAHVGLSGVKRKPLVLTVSPQLHKVFVVVTRGGLGDRSIGCAAYEWSDDIDNSSPGGSGQRPPLRFFPETTIGTASQHASIG